MPWINKVDRHRVGEMGDFHRAGGTLVCKHCGFQYHDHPPVVGYEWLKRLCNGDLVKL